MTRTADGVEIDATAVGKIAAEVVGARGADVDDAAWYRRLREAQAVLGAAKDALQTRIDDHVAAMVEATSERAVAEQLGMSESWPGQLARRSRRRRNQRGTGGTPRA